MTLMTKLKNDWAISGTSAEGVTALRSWAARHDVLEGFETPFEVSAAVHRGAPESNSIIAALLHETGLGDRWARDTCLHALRPFIGHTIRRVGGSAVTDGLVSEMMAQSLDIIMSMASGSYPAMTAPISVFSNRLLNRGRHRRSVRIKYENQIAFDFDFDDSQFDEVSVSRRPDGRVPGVELIEFLATAVRLKVVTADEARLVGRRALLDERMTHVVGESVGVRAMQKRHHRIVERLIEAAPRVAGAMVA